MNDPNFDLGYPSVFGTSNVPSANTSSHNSPLTRSPSPDHFGNATYSRTSSASPYSLSSATLNNFNGPDALNLSLNNVDATPRGPLSDWPANFGTPQSLYQKPLISGPTYAGPQVDMYPFSPSNHSSPDSNDERAIAAGGNLTTNGHGQWNHTPILMTAAPDPIEPFFKTLKERNLVGTGIDSLDRSVFCTSPLAISPTFNAGNEGLLWQS